MIYDLTDNGYISLGSINNFSLTQASSNQQPSNNRLLYTPGPTDSVITSNEVRNDGILVNGEIVRSLDGSNNSAQVIATSEYDNNRDLIREVSYQGKRIGTIRLHAQINNNAFQLQDNAGHEPTWL